MIVSLKNNTVIGLPITGKSATSLENGVPNMNTDPKRYEALFHISCEHGPAFCDVLKERLQDEFEVFEPVFVEATNETKIRPDEGTIIRLKNVPRTELKALARRISNVKCVHKVDALLKR